MADDFRFLQPQQVLCGMDHLARGEAGLIKGQESCQKDRQYQNPAEGPRFPSGVFFGAFHGPLTSFQGRGTWGKPGETVWTRRVSPGFRPRILSAQ